MVELLIHLIADLIISNEEDSYGIYAFFINKSRLLFFLLLNIKKILFFYKLRFDNF